MEIILISILIYSGIVLSCNLCGYIKKKLDAYYKKKYANLDELEGTNVQRKIYKPDADSDDELYTNVYIED
jgi:hypothetical protein